MKKLVLNKIIAGTMAAAIVLSTVVTAFASDTQQITPGNTGSTTVKATVESEAVVWIPTNITISGTPDENKKYTGEGAVIVEGDIAGNQLVTVTPESNISLKQPGKDDIVAQVTQEKTTFTYDDIQNSNSAITTISADSLSAGEWNSVLHYNVSLDENPLPPGYTTLYEYDLSATENDDVKAYYMVPNKNTSPIEVETGSTTGNMNLLTSFTNLFTPITAYAAENNVIDYNGVRYELSDEDTLVISGEGEMKENIQADLMNYIGIYNAVADKFNISYSVDASDTNNVTEGETVAYFGTNNLKPSWICQKLDGVKYSTYNIADWNGYKHSLELDELSNNIEVYINEIVADYSISMPKEVIILEGVTNISDKAFYNCDSLTNVTIPNSVKEIGSFAFCDCSLNKVTIPDGVTHISMHAFDGTNLSEIEIPDGVTSIGNSAFNYCTNLSVVKLPASVTRIDSSAFTRIKIGATIYCETQQVADMLIANKNYTKPGTYIVVAPEMFS